MENRVLMLFGTSAICGVSSQSGIHLTAARRTGIRIGGDHRPARWQAPILTNGKSWLRARHRARTRIAGSCWSGAPETPRKFFPRFPRASVPDRAVHGLLQRLAVEEAAEIVDEQPGHEPVALRVRAADVGQHQNPPRRPARILPPPPPLPQASPHPP